MPNVITGRWRHALLLALAMACAGLAPQALGAPTVRVLLAEGLDAVDVRVDGAHEVRSPRGRARTDFALAWPLRAADGEVATAERHAGAWVELHPEAGTVRFGGRSYRGALRIEAAGGGLRVVNLVGLEAYLRGVVPAEMKALWPVEALKAQAVAARSYTLAQLDPAAPWDVCASDACQVYSGIQAEHPRSDRAVRDTEGIVISYGGAPAVAYYHADSGGVVASSAEVWGRALPYLVSRTDVDAASPHRGWTVTLEPAALARALAEEGRTVGTPTSLAVTRHGPSRRAAAAVVTGSAGKIVLDGRVLTRVLRAAGLRSTQIVSLGGLRVRGDGWGHGVGMSQYGARALAQAGHDYGQILAFYYPGVGLQRRVYRAADATSP